MVTSRATSPWSVAGTLLQVGRGSESSCPAKGKAGLAEGFRGRYRQRRN